MVKVPNCGENNAKTMTKLVGVKLFFSNKVYLSR